MADRSKIEWTDASWNPIRAQMRRTDAPTGWHCERVSEACRNCYAESINLRLGTQLNYVPKFRENVRHFLDEKMLLVPLRWKRPRRIFLCSMTDAFGDWVSDEWLDRIFAVMALCPQHMFQVLTKRSARMRAYICDKSQARSDGRGTAVMGMGYRGPLESLRWPLPNVWLGVTAEDQQTADERIPDLLSTAAAVRFISAEPLLGPIDLTSIRDPRHFPGCLRKDVLSGREYHEDDDDQWTVGRKLDWVICGGESGPHARPMHPDWARALLDQCDAAGVPFFFKQWGEYLPVGQSLPGYGKVCGGTAPQPGRMKLHYIDAPRQVVKHAFAGRGVAFASMADNSLTFRVGKSSAGALLDGIEHNAFPEGRA